MFIGKSINSSHFNDIISLFILSSEQKIKYINESKKQEDEELLDEELVLDNSKKSCFESCCECFSKSMECCFPLAICLFLLGQK